jgi:hypothetical protein
MEESRMVTRRRLWFSLGVVIVLALLGGWALIGSGDDSGTEGNGVAQETGIVDGTFVGNLLGTDAFVAVVVSPAPRGQERREVQVYISDGKRLSEWLSGKSVLRNTFIAATDDRDREATGQLTANSAEGSVKFPDGKTARYSAKPASGAAGLYELTVSSEGKLSGASAAGVGLTSASTLKAPGTGTFEFADGKRRKFNVTGGSAGGPLRLTAGQVRLIVLPDGQMRGAVDRRPASGGDADLFIRSAG